MKIQIRFFASVREKLGCSAISFESDAETLSTAEVREQLIQRGEPWSEALGKQKVLRLALNQNMINDEAQLSDGDELAFFPPVTGG